VVRPGQACGTLVVEAVASNAKRRARVRRIVPASGAPPERVVATLDDADGGAKGANVSLVARVHAGTARERLRAADGSVGRALPR
jgi:N-acetylmuramic acid 6-phosphate (MurNAc-6-P) etherase